MDNRLLEIKRLQEKNWFPNKNYLTEKKINTKYAFYRIVRPIIKLKFKYNRWKNRPSPWISPASRDFLGGYLNENHKMAEFGSGKSTIFFSSKAGEIISIEHHKGWYERIKKILQEQQIKNVTYLFVEINEEQETNEEPSFMKLLDIGLDEFKYKKKFRNYFNALNSYEDKSFDVILVDGRSRPECVFSSIRKLKKGGMMILDNSERDRYKIIFQKLKNWEMVNTTNGLTDTTFWVKP